MMFKGAWAQRVSTLPALSALRLPFANGNHLSYIAPTAQLSEILKEQR
jgi:hypothetical protein